MSAPAPVAETDEKTFMEKLTFVWSLFKGISILKRFRASRDCGGSMGGCSKNIRDQLKMHPNIMCCPPSLLRHGEIQRLLADNKYTENHCD